MFRAALTIIVCCFRSNHTDETCSRNVCQACFSRSHRDYMCAAIHFEAPQSPTDELAHDSPGQDLSKVPYFQQVVPSALPGGSDRLPSQRADRPSPSKKPRINARCVTSDLQLCIARLTQDPQAKLVLITQYYMLNPTVIAPLEYETRHRTIALLHVNHAISDEHCNRSPAELVMRAERQPWDVSALRFVRSATGDAELKITLVGEISFTISVNSAKLILVGECANFRHRVRLGHANPSMNH